MVANSRVLVFLVATLCLALSACMYTEQDAKEFLPGKYNYRIPSGELQVLTIDSSFTFKQMVYSNNDSLLYENTGKMIVEGEDIELEHWLECYELADPILRSEPIITYSTGIFWRKPAEDHDVLIIAFDQTNYIFEKRPSMNNDK